MARTLSLRPRAIALAVARAWSIEHPLLRLGAFGGIALFACGANAAAPLPAGTVPVPAANFVGSGAASRSVAGSTLTVNQTSARAVLNWQSFNISPEAAVRFNQPNAAAAVLNRIHDANPSVIQGRLTANGQVYLYNRNGILFDRGAQVNVNTLVATTLNITDEVFNRGLLSQERLDQAVLAWDGSNADFGKSFVRVENGAEIRTETNGRVLLFAPRVENNGSIATPEGQTVLAGGAKVYLAASADTRLRGFLVEVDPAADGTGGKVSNEALGRIVAERGNVTLAGLAVNQSGRVTATTSASLNGSIVLSARDSATLTQSGLAGSRGGTAVLGAGSVTEVLPDATDKRTVQDNQTFLRSRIAVSGETIHLRENARIVAPNGEVTLTAQRGLEFQQPGEAARDGVRIQLDAGSRIDVAGLRDVAVPIERNIIEIDLRGNELKDAPLQRDGALRNQTVRIDIRKGTPLADVSGLAQQLARSTEERSAEGGTVVMRSEGDIVLRQASTVDVSGGSIRYSDGYLATSKLYTADHKVIDIGVASPERLYLGIADEFVVRNAKFGMVETLKTLARGEFTSGYVEGRNAGTVTLTGHRVVVDGDLIGTTVIGPTQREQNTRPLGGQLIVGDPIEQSSPADFKLGNVRFAARREPLPGDFQFDDRIPQSWADTLLLPTGLTREGGFSRLTVLANGSVVLPAGETLELAPWGSVQLNARSVTLDGAIHAPSGTIVARTSMTAGRDGGGLTASEYVLSVGPSSILSTAGIWVNDSIRAAQAVPFAPIAIDGGGITLASQSDVRLAAGSVLDVSAGAYLSAADKLIAGNAGAISVSTGRFGLNDADPQTSILGLGAELRAFALGKGGALALSASRVRLGATPSPDQVELYLAPEFLSSNGFAKITLAGQDGVTVAPGISASLVAPSLVLDADFATRPSATPMTAFTRRQLLPAQLRSPTELTLSTGSRLHGDLVIGQGATLEVDAAGKITLTSARQLTVNGSLVAPAGAIGLAILPPGTNDSFLPELSIWLGTGSRLLAHGVLMPEYNRDGLALGEVLAGGTVTLNAASGYVIAQQGSLIDVSGTAAALDLPTQIGNRVILTRTLVPSAAGSIALSAREGLLLDGALRAHQGGSGAAGGSLSIVLERSTIPLAYPAQGPRRVLLAREGQALPPGLAAGAAVPDVLNGVGQVFTAAVEQGGFHRFSAEAEHRIEFDGAVSLATARSIELNAPLLAGGAHAAVQLTTGYLSLGNLEATRVAPATVDAGTATFTAHAERLDLRGAFGIAGFQQTVFASAGDIELRGIVSTPTSPRPEGALRVGGNLSLQGRQLYPSTRTRFSVEAQGERSVLSILPAGSDTPVLSADGSVTLRAYDVVIGGAVKAPFGEIAIEASNSLRVDPGGVLSVSAEGLTIPFGATELAGRRYVYPLAADNRVIVTELGEKRIVLEAPSVMLSGGAKVDISGGGELFATEFLPGTGGSRDVLDPANAGNTFAILPSLGARYAPSDPYYALNIAALSAGDGVSLAGVPGLADGTYALLPARYALLPGAFLVTPVANTRDMVGAQTYTKADGSIVVPGNRVAAGAGGIASRDARTSGFNVRPGASARSQSEYLETTASQFFGAAGGRVLPADAGRLVVQAGGQLELAASVATAAASGGRGAAIDIAAPRLAVTASADQTVDAGFVRLEAGRLNALKAASLLLGGTRSDEGDRVRIAVGASAIVVANDAATVLRGPELILVATDTVSVRPQGHLDASGTAALDPRAFVIGGDPGTSGDGALVRLSSGMQVDVQRENVSRANGFISIAPEASVAASASMRLDATLDTQAAGALVLGSAGTLALGAGRISLGETDGVLQGLVLSNERLRTIGTAAELQLRSYSSVDFYGAVQLGTADLRTLTIHAGGLSGYGSGTPQVRIQADRVVLGGGDGLVYSSAPALANGATPVLGNGDLAVRSRVLDLSGGEFAMHGFAAVELTAAGGMRFSGSGALDSDGPLKLDTGRITAADRVRFDVRSAGTLQIVSPAGASPDLNRAGVGSVLGFSGRAVSVASVVDAPSGEIRIEAIGSTLADAVHIDPGARLSTAGLRVVFEDTEAVTAGGRVDLIAAAGDVIVGSGAIIDVSAEAGGDGGTLSILAPTGRFESSGQLLGGSAASACVPDPRQSTISIDVAAISGFSALQTNLGSIVDANGVTRSRGFMQERVFRVRDDDLTLAADARIQAQHVLLVADAGDLDIMGTIDASGPSGGRIELYAGGAGRIDLRSGAVLDARATTGAQVVIGTQGRGGRVVMGVGGEGGLSVASGARVDVSPAGAGERGEILLRAPRNGNDVAIENLAATIIGAGEVSVEAYRVYDKVGSADITSIGTSAVAGRLTFAQINDDNVAYLSTSNVNAMRTRLGLVDTDETTYAVRAGVEVRAAGDLALVNDWDLRTARPGGHPGVLSLRAAGNLLLSSSLSDGFSNATASGVLQTGTSWSYRLVAGADHAGANPLAVKPGGGDVEVAPGKLVRTGTGDISIAAGRDVLLRYSVRDSDPAPNVENPVLNVEPGVVYTAGAASPVVASFPGITINGIAASFPTGGGDLGIYAARDIATRSTSALDIVSAPITQFFTDWLYRQGSLAADGTIGSFSAPRTGWWPRYSDFRQGFGALGGGNVELIAQRNVDAVSASLPTNGRLPAPNNSIPAATLLVVQGGGDLTVSARGNIDSSSFLVGAGAAHLAAGGDIGGSRLTAKDRRPLYTSLSIGQGTATVSARGDLTLETVASPTAIEQAPGNFAGSGGSNRRSYFFTYGDDSSTRLRSAAGSVTLLNEPIGLGQFASRFASGTDALFVYPSAVRIEAPQGDIRIGGNFELYPSAHGGLDLLAGGSIAVDGRIGMIDALPSRLPSVASPDRNTERIRIQAAGLSPTGIDAHANPPLHQSDIEPVRFIALGGDITGPVAFDAQGIPSIGTMAILPKPVVISAGGDVRDAWIFGQNLREDDVSRISAGGDFRYSTVGGSGSRARLEWGGPGRLEIFAGGSIDLGDSQGIVTRGNLNNPALAERGASIILVAGAAFIDYSGFIDRALARPEGPGRLDIRGSLISFMRALGGDPSLDADRALAGFRALPAESQGPLVRALVYDALKQTGRTALTSAGGIERYDLGYNAIADLFPSATGTVYAGDLNLFFSQVKTEQGGDIEILVPGGVVNAGLASVGGSRKADSELGIVTVRGGAVRAMVRDDFFVNQSRVFTLQGGDILIWSSDGNIDAGRGAKSASATPPPQVITRGDQIVLDITNSISGSGIGVLLAKEGVTPGDVDLIAPRGEINAGEAPIRAAGNINIAAERVVGADNIQVGGTATGVALQAAPAFSSSLAGGSNPAGEATRSAEQATRSASASGSQSMGGDERFRPTFLTVEVLGFGDEGNARPQDESRGR